MTFMKFAFVVYALVGLSFAVGWTLEAWKKDIQIREHLFVAAVIPFWPVLLSLYAAIRLKDWAHDLRLKHAHSNHL
jgi:hypothetical protein